MQTLISYIKNSIGSMTRGIKLSQQTILAFLLLSLICLSGCTTVKPYYFNDSDKIFVGNATEQPPKCEFDWVLMSKGKFRQITTANPL